MSTTTTISELVSGYYRYSFGANSKPSWWYDETRAENGYMQVFKDSANTYNLVCYCETYNKIYQYAKFWDTTGDETWRMVPLYPSLSDLASALGGIYVDAPSDLNDAKQVGCTYTWTNPAPSHAPFDYGTMANIAKANNNSLLQIAYYRSVGSVFKVAIRFYDGSNTSFGSWYILNMTAI